MNDDTIIFEVPQQGSRGPMGVPGPVGETGPRGLTGVKGEQGDKGDTGDQGAPGEAGAGYNTVSTTSNTIANTGTKVFTVETARSFVFGQRVRCTSNTGAYMEGTVISYVEATDTAALTVAMVYSFGSGTFTNWTISITGDVGITGATGSVPLLPIVSWATAQAYVIGPPASFVQYSGSSYECLVSHTSGVFNTDLAALKWGLVAAKGDTGPVGGGDMLRSTYDSNQDGIIEMPQIAAIPESKVTNLVTDLSTLTTNVNAKIPTTYLDTDVTLAANSDTKIATQKATKAHVAAAIALVGGTPPGCILMFPMGTAPSGYLECSGQSVSRATYANLFAVIGTTYGSLNGSSFSLPDLRGEFIRGWDHSRGIDPGRSLGSVQGSDFGSHAHSVTETTLVNGFSPLYMNFKTASDGSEPTANPSGSTGLTTSYAGGSETRPRNFALMYCIKT